MSDGSFDIALLDFNMPGMNGLELLAKLRGIYSEMAVAMVSANIQDTVVARTRELGATFIAKPFSEEALSDFLSGAVLRLRRRSHS